MAKRPSATSERRPGAAGSSQTAILMQRQVPRAVPTGTVDPGHGCGPSVSSGPSSALGLNQRKRCGGPDDEKTTAQWRLMMMVGLFLQFAEFLPGRRPGQGRAEYALIAVVLSAPILFAFLGIADNMANVALFVRPAALPAK